jgi:tRNA threonylcarbamoyladenosine biosynthesis protein TsaE
MKSITISSLQELDSKAVLFLDLAAGHSVIAFSGELGAGKTTFIQAICRNLGVDVDVNSPTFSLVNEYFTPDGSSIFHFDLYRIETAEELFDMGYEEYFYSGSMCLIEWPEKARQLIPDNALWVKIVMDENEARHLQFG